MRLLLDTHTLAWVVGDPSLLSERAHALLLDPENELLVGPASVWEMSIKHRAGKWPEVAPFMDEQRYAGFAQRLGVQEHKPHARSKGCFLLRRDREKSHDQAEKTDNA